LSTAARCSLILRLPRPPDNCDACTVQQRNRGRGVKRGCWLRRLPAQYISPARRRLTLRLPRGARQSIRFQRINGSFNNAAVGTALAQANGIQALDRKRQVIVLTGDGGLLKGKRVGGGPDFDLAVISVSAERLTAIGFGALQSMARRCTNRIAKPVMAPMGRAESRTASLAGKVR
jgi:hypothetical protein